MIPLTISRTSTIRLVPPRLANGINGATKARAVSAGGWPGPKSGRGSNQPITRAISAGICSTPLCPSQNNR